MISVRDDGGCKSEAFTWISTPVRIVVGCRLRMPDHGGFPFSDGQIAAKPCPLDMPARFEWFEVSAGKAEPDPLLAMNSTRWWHRVKNVLTAETRGRLIP